MSIWIGLALIVVGLAAFLYGDRNRFGSFRGNFAQRVRGDVTQNYTEGQAAPPQPQQPPNREERFIKWAGLVIALGGFIVAVAKLIAG
jgi:hypothetical protein